MDTLTITSLVKLMFVLPAVVPIFTNVDLKKRTLKHINNIGVWTVDHGAEATNQ